jgi:hypothetical protein
MNETQWHTCKDPQRLLKFLGRRASPRKLRLFACACCRRVGDLLKDQRSRAALDAAERFADGLIGAKALRKAESAALDATRAAELAYWDSMDDNDWPVWRSAAAAAWAVSQDDDWALETAGEAADVRAGPWRPAMVLKTEHAAQCHLVRDIFGNPFRPLSPAALVPGPGEAARRLAQAVYEEGRFADLPMLGDALVAAGCRADDILAHCRSGADHVRGCHVVDMVLARE